MAQSKKDYERIAVALGIEIGRRPDPDSATEALERLAIRDVARRLQLEFGLTNPRFDQSFFIQKMEDVAVVHRLTVLEERAKEYREYMERKVQA